MLAIALPAPSTLPSSDPARLESAWSSRLPLRKDACSGIWQALLTSTLGTFLPSNYHRGTYIIVASKHMMHFMIWVNERGVEVGMRGRRRIFSLGIGLRIFKPTQT